MNNELLLQIYALGHEHFTNLQDQYLLELQGVPEFLFPPLLSKFISVLDVLTILFGSKTPDVFVAEKSA